MTFFIRTMQKLFGLAAQPETQEEASPSLRALEQRCRKALNTFEETRDAKHLQTAADAIYDAIRQTYGTLISVVAFQSGGWPRAWERSFSLPPAAGAKSQHDAVLYEMLKDIGEALGKWESLPSRDAPTLLDNILIRRNRRNSPFLEFGKTLDSGHWPHDDFDRRV